MSEAGTLSAPCFLPVGLEALSGFGFQQAARIHPFNEALRPQCYRTFGGCPHAEAVPHAGIYMQLGLSPYSLHLEIKFRKALGNVLAVVLTAHKKRRRHVFREGHVGRNSRIHQAEEADS